MKVSLLLYCILIILGCNNQKATPTKSISYKPAFSLPKSPIFLSKTFAVKNKPDTNEILSLKNNPNLGRSYFETPILWNSDTIIYYKRASVAIDSFYRPTNLFEYSPGFIKFCGLKKTNKDLFISCGIGCLKINVINQIKLDAIKNVIIDNSDTMVILDHWQMDKLIFVDADKSTNPSERKQAYYKFNTIIYSYQ